MIQNYLCGGYVNIFLYMFGEETGKAELTIAEQTNWRSIKGGDMDTALEIATAYRKAEMSTVDSVQFGRTESDMGSIMMAVCARGVDIPLEEIPVSKVVVKDAPLKYKLSLAVRKISWQMRQLSSSEKPYDRSLVIDTIIKNPKDFNKLPPIVVTKNADGKYLTMDGQNRSAKAKRLDPKMNLRGYVIPFDLAYNPQILEEAAKNYDLLIRERGGALIEIPKPETNHS